MSNSSKDEWDEWGELEEEVDRIKSYKKDVVKKESKEEVEEEDTLIKQEPKYKTVEDYEQEIAITTLRLEEKSNLSQKDIRDLERDLKSLKIKLQNAQSQRARLKAEADAKAAKKALEEEARLARIERMRQSEIDAEERLKWFEYTSAWMQRHWNEYAEKYGPIEKGSISCNASRSYTILADHADREYKKHKEQRDKLALKVVCSIASESSFLPFNEIFNDVNEYIGNPIDESPYDNYKTISSIVSATKCKKSTSDDVVKTESKDYSDSANSNSNFNSSIYSRPVRNERIVRRVFQRSMCRNTLCNKGGCNYLHNLGQCIDDRELCILGAGCSDINCTNLCHVI